MLWGLQIGVVGQERMRREYRLRKQSHGNVKNSLSEKWGVIGAACPKVVWEAVQVCDMPGGRDTRSS